MTEDKREKTIPPPPPKWLWQAAYREDKLAMDLLTVRDFIEAVMLDDESFEQGLWQGEMPKRALAAIDRLIEQYGPYSCLLTTDLHTRYRAQN